MKVKRVIDNHIPNSVLYVQVARFAIITDKASTGSFHRRKLHSVVYLPFYHPNTPYTHAHLSLSCFFKAVCFTQATFLYRLQEFWSDASVSEFLPGCTFWNAGNTNIQWGTWCASLRLTLIGWLIDIIVFLPYHSKVCQMPYLKVHIGWYNQVLSSFSRCAR